MTAPPYAKQLGGVWLPDTETHFVDWMTRSKRARRVDGKLTYQYHKLEAALAHQPAGRRRAALDVGAHVGLWSMWLARAFATLHAFEPVPLFADIFLYNVPAENVALHRVALGAEAKSVAITVPLAQTGAAHLSTRAAVNVKYDAGGRSETWHGVPMVTLDSYGFETVDFLKIDVEGAEVEVLRGGEATIRRCRPNVVVEAKGNETAYGHAAGAAVDLLRTWGMRPREVLSGDWILGFD